MRANQTPLNSRMAWPLCHLGTLLCGGHEPVKWGNVKNLRRLDHTMQLCCHEKHGRANSDGAVGRAKMPCVSSSTVAEE